MHDVIMPKLGLTMEEGTIVRWAKKEGDPVREGEILLEVETDKATNELEAPASGVLGKILLGEGQSAPVLAVVGFILEKGETPPQVWPTTLASPLVAEVQGNSSGAEIGMAAPQTSALGSQSEPVDETFDRSIARSDESQGNVNRVSDKPQEAVSGRGPTTDLQKVVSPRAKRLASELGVPLDQIRGSGPGGRVTAEDVESYAKARTFFVPGRLQQITARRMVESFTSIPHFYLKVEVDASRLIALREKLLPALRRTFEVQLTLTDMFVLLVAKTLQAHPHVNASWMDGRIALLKDINIGIATALTEGLVVPVLRQADQKRIEEIARERASLVQRAASGRLGLPDLEGGTFTITNLGMLGVDEFAPIINPPESAILAIGRIADRVVAEAGRPVIRPTFWLTMSMDHRVLDGAQGARFLRDLKGHIEQPEEIIRMHVGCNPSGEGMPSADSTTNSHA